MTTIERNEGYRASHILKPILFLSAIAMFPHLAPAATISSAGTFAADNQVDLFSVTADTSEPITIQTSSYASGGFAPTAFLFDDLGDVLTLGSGGCGLVGMDPTTENCDDIFFQDTLGPGTYTLALAVYDNTPVDSSLSDGFIQDTNPGFTCQEGGASGSFCDVTSALYVTRTGDYAISFTGADSVSQLTGGASTPEPGSIFLLIAGGAFTALRLRRDSKSSERFKG